ncbi:MAG: ABC transporter permease [Niabella sp.]
MSNHSHTEQWTEVIKPQSNLLDINLKEVWHYRDLLMLLVKRDFIAVYKQTILGPLWFFIQPLLTSLMFVVVFGRIAGLSTEGVPQMLFYIAGITLWTYFAECLNKTATVFKDNANIFGKVYFPRLIMPLSIVTSNLVKFGVQLILFLIIWIYYLAQPHSPIHPNIYMALLPVLIVLMAGMALGFGMIISAMTNKYKDLVFLLTFAVQLAMYATPVAYPLSTVSEKYQWLLKLNPMTSIVETFRHGFLGSGTMDGGSLLYTTVITMIILFLGTIIFNKVEKSFMDTV